MHELVGTAREIARHSREEARHAIWDLRSPRLGTGAFSLTLENELRPLANSGGLKLTVAARGEEKPLPARLQHHLLRVAKEALTNTIKYAGASAVCVEIEQTEQTIMLHISDNGCGIDPAVNVTAPGHFGFCGMRERADRLNGSLTIASEAGKGVAITVCLPLNSTEKARLG